MTFKISINQIPLDVLKHFEKELSTKTIENHISLYFVSYFKDY